MTVSKVMGKSWIKPKLSTREIEEYRRHVDFSPEEIQHWFQEYRKSLRGRHKNLRKEEFVDVYNSVYPGDATRFAQHLFRTFDKTHNERVSFKEFLIGMCISGKDTSTDSKLQWAFEMYDISENGLISKEEISEILESVYTMTQVTDLVHTNEIVNEIFRHFDLNKDGKISFEEFKRGALEVPMIIHVLELDPHPHG